LRAAKGCDQGIKQMRTMTGRDGIAVRPLHGGFLHW
jgi:hypothetical protein